MTGVRKATLAVFGLRVVYGAGLIVAPTRLARRWLGPAAAAAPTQIPLRGLGAREIVLHTAAIGAGVRGSALRPWLLASVVGDLSDIVATFAGSDQLPRGAARATLVVAGGSALLSAGLAVAVEN